LRQPQFWEHPLQKQFRDLGSPTRERSATFPTQIDANHEVETSESQISQTTYHHTKPPLPMQ
jgi:hypothetical protein